jgi:peptidoglycan/LPS O-acetylase OafA/YrhL
VSEITEGEILRTQQRLDALTGLRIVAALWVLAHHLSADVLPRLPFLAVFDPIISRGGLGVDLFFILSGFILSYNYVSSLGKGWHGRRSIRFLQLRLARVYPVHLVTSLSAVAMFFVASALDIPYQEQADNTPLSFIANLLLVQTWFGQPYSWNGVAWSVSAEWFAYLLFPIAALLIIRVRSTWLAVSVGLATWGASLMIEATLRDETATDRPDYPLIRIAVAFIIGCMMHRLFENTRSSRGWGIGAVAAVLTIIALTLIPGIPNAVFLAPLAALILCLAHGRGALSWLLSTRPLVWGGLVSYSLYMVHGQVLQVTGALLFDRLPDNTLISALLTIGTVLACFVAAATVFYLVEEPSRRLIRSWRFGQDRMADKAESPATDADSSRAEDPRTVYR